MQEGGTMAEDEGVEESEDSWLDIGLSDLYIEKEESLSVLRSNLKDISELHNQNLSGDNTSVSKNRLRKQQRYEQILATKKEKRKDEKRRKKERKALEIENRKADIRISKKQEKELTRTRLKNALVNGIVIAIDLQFVELMTQKEKTRLALQLGRVYGSNKKFLHPAHIHFVNLREDSTFYQLCCAKNEGFQDYIVSRSEFSVTQLFQSKDIVYLSPDAQNVLTGIDVNKVYVIGGLVDETVKKQQSFTFARNESIPSARLPIKEILVKGDSGTFNTILTINQVFDILMTYLDFQDWRLAMLKHVPVRKGFQ
ncbi:tRNA methyltransferase 10 homolog B-like [Oratosquilla oratoria]|uniref:tRNA methyltransferase 10 homolog B-like n=1 Tax=Oratosquilla oratoria TaxID=337810 RepID=UPI003F7748F6